jgi:hypothetical protein
MEIYVRNIDKSRTLSSSFTCTLAINVVAVNFRKVEKIIGLQMVKNRGDHM